MEKKANNLLTKEEIYDIIEKALIREGFVGKNDDYNGDVSSIPSKVKGQLNKFNKSIRNLDHETALIVDGNGNRVYYQEEGTADQLQLGFDASDEKYRNVDLHMTHNHPQKTINISTFLSPQDIRNFSQYKYFNVGENDKVDSLFKFKSMSAEGSNGSRMTMTMVDEDKFRKNAFKDYEDIKFRKAVSHYDETCQKWLENVESEVDNHMQVWMDNRVATARSKGEDLDLQTFMDECDVEKRKFQKEYSLNNMKDFFSKDYKKFESMGLEVSIGWLK